MNNQQNVPSSLWIVLYITLHLVWLKFVPRTFYPVLTLSFAALFIFTRTTGEDLAGTVKHLIGRWLPERRDMPIAIAFVLASAALRVLVGRCFVSTPISKHFATVADLSVLAPLGEELICRGLFLGILLAKLPRRPSVAVVWSAAIFLGLHSYAGSDVPAVAAVFSLGLLCGATYVTTRCVPLCIVCHSIYNTLGWWVDRTGAPQITEFSDVLWGLVFFISGALLIGWLLKLFIKKLRRNGTGQLDGAGNPSQPPSPEVSQTPSAAGS